MSVREITEKELLLECDRISSIAFCYSWDQEEAAKNLEKPDHRTNVTFGSFNQEGALAACLQLPEYRVWYQGQSVPMVGVGGVASLPEHRRGGAIRELFQTALPWMRQRGAVLSSLYPFSHLFYRKFGYELCHFSFSYKIPTEALASFSCTCQVRMLLPGEGLEADLPRLRQVYNAWLGQHNLTVDREDRHWKDLVGTNATKERRYAYLLEEDGKPLAYVIFTAEDAPAPQGKTGKIRELASAVSEEPDDRQSLSTFRTMGGTLAGVVIGVGLPLIAYQKVDGVETLIGTRVTIAAGVFSVLAGPGHVLHGVLGAHHRRHRLLRAQERPPRGRHRLCAVLLRPQAGPGGFRRSDRSAAGAHRLLCRHPYRSRRAGGAVQHLGAGTGAGLCTAGRDPVVLVSAA